MLASPDQLDIPPIGLEMFTPNPIYWTVSVGLIFEECTLVPFCVNIVFLEDSLLSPCLKQKK